MFRRLSLVAALASAPAVASAQANPVATAFKANVARQAKNLVAAAEIMPAGKYGYKPTPAQMSFGQIVEHLSEGNDELCGVIAGTKAPQRAKVTVADGKDKLVARLKETFEFCNTALANLTDAHLDEPLDMFGMKMSRADVEFVTVGDWSDHYSQFANYLRLNGMLPPTAKPAAKPAPKPAPKPAKK